MAFLCDTNVLNYAAGDRAHPLAAPAMAMVRAITTHEIRATTTPEVLQEFMHTYSRRRSRPLARARCEEFAALLTPLRTVDEATILRAAEEYERRPTIGAFDAVLVAIVMDDDDLELVTADRALLALDDVPVRDLASFAPA